MVFSCYSHHLISYFSSVFVIYTWTNCHTQLTMIWNWLLETYEILKAKVIAYCSLPEPSDWFYYPSSEAYNVTSEEHKAISDHLKMLNKVNACNEFYINYYVSFNICNIWLDNKVKNKWFLFTKNHDIKQISWFYTQRKIIMTLKHTKM